MTDSCGWSDGSFGEVPASPAEYLPVRNVTRAVHPHVAHRHDTPAEGDVSYVELDRVDGSIEIGPPEAGSGGPQPTIVFDRTDEPKSGKLRLHIDVNATDRD